MWSFRVSTIHQTVTCTTGSVINVGTWLYCNVLYCIDGRIYLNLFKINSKSRRAQSFEACSQCALLNVQIISLLFPFTVQKYMYLPVSKMHAGSFRVSVIHRILTWTIRSLTCVCSFVCVRIHTRFGHTNSESSVSTCWLRKTPKKFLLSWRRLGSNLGSLDLKSDALPTEPPLHPIIINVYVFVYL